MCSESDAVIRRCVSQILGPNGTLHLGACRIILYVVNARAGPWSALRSSPTTLPLSGNSEDAVSISASLFLGLSSTLFSFLRPIKFYFLFSSYFFASSCVALGERRFAGDFRWLRVFSPVFSLTASANSWLRSEWRNFFNNSPPAVVVGMRPTARPSRFFLLRSVPLVPLSNRSSPPSTPSLRVHLFSPRSFNRFERAFFFVSAPGETLRLPHPLAENSLFFSKP